MLIKSRVVLGLTSRDGKCPIFPGDTAVVDDEEGRRAVEAGYAWELDSVPSERPGSTAPVSAPGENPSEDENAQNGALNPENEITETEDLGKLEDMSFNQLKQIAKDLGIATGKIKSKEGMIAAISEVATGIPADEEPPVFEAQEVVE